MGKIGSAIALVVFFSLNSFATIIQPYPYPFQQSDLATVSAVFANGSSDVGEVLTVPGMPERKSVPLTDGRVDSEVVLYAQKEAAPLVFVISGFSGHAQGGTGGFLAEMLFKAGNSVITIPSPSTWQFLLGANSAGVPGYTPGEAVDLYHFMESSLAIVQQKHNLHITKFAVVGYSLGAAHAAFFPDLDAKFGTFHFVKYLLINPPLDMRYATQTLDGLYDISKGWSQQKIDFTVSAALDFEDRHSQDSAMTIINAFPKDPAFAGDKPKFLIGYSFRLGLSDLIVVSQLIHNAGILRGPLVADNRDQFEADALHTSFTDFSDKAMVPFWQNRLGLHNPQEVYDRVNVKNQLAKLAANPKVFLFHNEDDFLTKSDDLKAFENGLGDRATIFPYGGHLGNLWLPENCQLFTALFTNL